MDMYIEIQKGMPGLKQAVNIANTRLTTHLEKFGYKPVKHTPSLWRHESKPITFTLVVDDFGLKYEKIDDFNHLKAALLSLYKVTVDMSGTKYLGITLAWDYVKRHVDTSMPDYVPKALQRFAHEYSSSRQQHAPHKWNEPQYGRKGPQYVVDEKAQAKLPKEGKTLVQQVVGTFLYYALAIDITLLVALGTISAQQSQPTERTMSEITQLLDYCATNPNATIRFNASGMILWTDSDASYLSEPKARSRAGGFFFLSNNPTKPSTPDNPPRNGPIYAHASIIRVIVGSAMEAEIAAFLFFI